MRDTKKHTIDGFDYTIQQLGARVGKNVLVRILKMVGPAAAAGQPAEMAEKFAGSLNDADLDFLCDAFAKVTRFTPVGSDAMSFKILGDTFDDHFAGRYGAMMKWLWACVETNYADFLGELGVDPAALVSAAKAKASTSTAPTGLSGAPSSPVTGA